MAGEEDSWTPSSWSPSLSPAEGTDRKYAPTLPSHLPGLNHPRVHSLCGEKVLNAEKDKNVQLQVTLACCKIQISKFYRQNVNYFRNKQNIFIYLNIKFQAILIVFICQK